MLKLALSLAVGATAGALDVTPMLLRGADRHLAAVAFTHWVASGVLIGYSAIPAPPWLRGAAVAALAAAAALVRAATESPRSVAPMFVLSLVLGALAGVALARLDGAKA